MVSRVIPVEPFDLVVFGASGDLAQRKILPGLFHRFAVGQMPEEARIIGVARSEMDEPGFSAQVAESLAAFSPGAAGDAALVATFLEKISYVTVDATGDSGWAELGAKLRDGVVRAFYLSVSPALFGVIAQSLHAHKIATAQRRIVVEKPFGHDLK